MPVKSEAVVEDGPTAGNNMPACEENKDALHENKHELLRRLQKSVHFVKRMTSSNVGGQYMMAIPIWFNIKYGDKFERDSLLQLGILPVTKPWHVRLSFCQPSTPSNASPEVKLSKGWREFAVNHGLAEGDDLLFSLRAMSEFDVYVFRKPTPPPERSRGFDEEVPQRKTGECSSRHLFTTAKKPIIGDDNGWLQKSNKKVEFQEITKSYKVYKNDFKKSLP